jgi:hypothetical protein
MEYKIPDFLGCQNQRVGWENGKIMCSALQNNFGTTFIFLGQLFFL